MNLHVELYQQCQGIEESVKLGESDYFLLCLKT